MTLVVSRLLSSRAALVLAGSVAVLAGLAIVFAGPLTPPAGPVAPTYKTLLDVEPRMAINSTNTPGDATALYVISQPGSYYLTGNINGVAGKHGIAVTSNDVTIDLNGFTLWGTQGSYDGIHADSVYMFRVSNGDVRSWGADGVSAVSSSYAVVNRVNAEFNGSNGIVVGAVGKVTGCTAASNGLAGISVFGQGLVESCQCSGNGTDGIDAGYQSTVRGCACTGNHDDGIQVESNCLITGNHCIDNGPVASGAGIYIIGSGARIEENSTAANHFGILCSPSSSANLVVKNTATANYNNFSVTIANQVAPIVSNPTANGFSTTNAWSNLSY